MKTNKILVVGILLFGTFLGKAQDIVNPYPDTLKIETDSQIEVAFSFYRMSDKKAYLTDDLWKSILGVMESSVESSLYQEGIVVSYQKIKKGDAEVARVKVDELKDKSDVFTIDKEGMKEVYSNRIDFVIYQPKLSISFSMEDLADLEEIKELSVESVWEQVDQKFENEGTRNLYNGNGVFKYGKANLDGIVGGPAVIDQIELSGGIGLGFYRDRFVPDINFKLAVGFPDRLGNQDIQFGLLYTQQYFFDKNVEQEYDLNVNGFLSAFFSKSFRKDYKIGVGAGKLLQQNGDFYQGDTYKFSLYTQKRDSRVNLTPELIFTENFKKAFPALKFGLSF
ncbi:MAG: hypothetical protein AB8B73_12420 [Ekhidna sp.]